MAGEFGIPADEVISLLRQMDVPVRSHMSLLTDDQVARIRARWEREKRTRAEKAAAPTTTARRRRTAPAPEPPPAPVAEGGIRRRRRADIVAAEPALAEVETDELHAEEWEESAPEIAAHAAEAGIAERAPSEVQRQVERSAEPAPAVEAAVEAPRPSRIPPRREFTPPEPIETPVPADEHHPAPRPVTPPSVSAQGTAAPSAPHAPSAPSGGGPERRRPRPITPGAPRPRPVASSGSPFAPPRPIASAAPGGASTGAPRREERRDDKTAAQRPPMGGGTMDRGRRKKGKRGAVDQEAVDANISKTMAAMRGAPSRRSTSDMRRGSREEMQAARAAEIEREKKLVRVNEFITVSELAQILKIPATEIVAFAFKNLGLMITINQRLDFDQIDLIAGEFGFQATREDEYQAEDALAAEADRVEDLEPRSPVVTIMGHVDHGKTSLLDYIRKANVVAGEAGGITQHIGAYHVTLPGGREITFLDTPGHQAFTAMRARGAQVTDIVVLVVAADDGAMPQTIEAISHARNANVPLIVAINKIDLPQANPARVKQELLQHGVVLEEFGGDVLSAEISAKKGTNVQQLLDAILLQAEIKELKANPHRRAVGTVVEAQLDPGKGPVATVLVQNGTLHVGEDFICGLYSGRVRALLDERGKAIKEAGPGIPAQVLGMEGVPQAGDEMLVLADATDAREIAQRRQRLDREAKSRRTSRGGVSLEDFMAQSTPGGTRNLRILIKADQGGPAEALADALGQLSTSEVKVEIVHRAVGAITESDILLAKASGAIIIGFHVRPDNNARTAAEREGVDVRLYRIIYEAVNDVRSALEGLLRPEQREVILGEAEVRDTFRVSRVGVIAGCSVRSGVISRQARVRVVRDAVEVYDGTIASLRRFKEDVREVREGFECGISVENFNDIKVGDVIECYRTEEVARTLDSGPAA